MINWEKSSQLNNMTVDELKAWFKNHPKSNKRIIRICNICDKEREIDSNQYRDLCQSCSLRTPEMREAARLKTIEQYSTQEARDDQADRVRQWHKNHPEFVSKHSKWMIEYCEDPEVRNVNSDRIKNSEAMQVEYEKQRGGHDICEHHYIYDHNDLTKYTMKMTRSRHQRLHRLMQKAGIKIPHINMKEESV